MTKVQAEARTLKLLRVVALTMDGFGVFGLDVYIGEWRCRGVRLDDGAFRVRAFKTDDGWGRMGRSAK